jgi:hypothetical protein
LRARGRPHGASLDGDARAMDEPFIVDEEIDARRGGVVLTGWETVVFELEDEPPYDVFGSDS